MTLLGWVHPSVIYWLVGLLVVALTALFGAGLGVAIGASIRHVMPVIVVSLVLTFYLFFLAGGVGVLAFEPTWLQQIAVFDPLTYGTHALQMALFYQSSDLLARQRHGPFRPRHADHWLDRGAQGDLVYLLKKPNRLYALSQHTSGL